MVMVLWTAWGGTFHSWDYTADLLKDATESHQDRRHSEDQARDFMEF